MHGVKSVSPENKKCPVILGVFAHPDDEAYAAAGLFCLCSQAGVRVVIACASAGDKGGCRHESSRELAVKRIEELRLSCHRMGAQEPVLLGFPDGSLKEVIPAMQARVGLLLQEYKPKAVVTLGLDGGYGHVDHIACTQAVARAVKRYSSKIRLFHTVFQPGLFRPIFRALKKYRSELIAALEEKDLGFAGPVDLTVNLAGLRMKKLDCVAAHRSQLKNGDPLSFLKPGFMEGLLVEEHYALAFGPRLPPNSRLPV
jgi:LmbE family N-acetylglucosaminyl deacetylase